MKNALGLAALAAIGVAVGAYIKREHFSAEISELPFRDVAVHNMQLRQDANVELNHLYGGMDEPELKIIDVFICKLRKKLASATGGKNYIETVWGRGYVLREVEDMDFAESA